MVSFDCKIQLNDAILPPCSGTSSHVDFTDKQRERKDAVPVWICIESACSSGSYETREETTITVGKIVYVLLATQKRNLVENFDDFSRDDFSKWFHRTLSFTHMQCWEMLFWLISTITFQHVSPHLDDTSASVADSFWMCLLLDNRRKNSKTVGLRSPAWPDLDSIDGCLDLSVFTEWNSYHCLLLALLSSSKP